MREEQRWGADHDTDVLPEPETNEGAPEEVGTEENRRVPRRQGANTAERIHIPAKIVVEGMRFADAAAIGIGGVAFYGRTLSRLNASNEILPYAAWLGIAAAIVLLWRPQAGVNPGWYTSLRALIKAFRGVAVAASAVVATSIAWGNWDQATEMWLLSWISSSLLGLAAVRIVFGPLIRRWSHSGLLARHVAVYGTGVEACHVVEEILTDKSGWLRLTAVLDCRRGRSDELVSSDIMRVGDGTNGLGATIARLGCDEIIIALPLTATARIRELCDLISYLPVKVFLPAGGFDIRSAGLPAMGKIALIPLVDLPLDDWPRMRKRAYDFILAAGLLLCLAPVLAAMTVAISLDSPGPILFRQKREGVNGSEIEVLKFRTMYAEQADPFCHRQSSEADPRVTRVGRFLRETGLDELPQLINVLMGDMSIVGPRPHATGMRIAGRPSAELVSKYRRRHAIKPGITGWAQINGSRGPMETMVLLRERVAFDLYYVENWSDFLYVKIFFITVVQLLKTIIVGRNSRRINREREKIRTQ